jgi:hypothetical protein
VALDRYCVGEEGVNRVYVSGKFGALGHVLTGSLEGTSIGFRAERTRDKVVVVWVSEPCSPEAMDAIASVACRELQVLDWPVEMYFTTRGETND